MSDQVQQAEQVKPTRNEQILKAKELYSQGSRNFLVGCFSEAADDLSQVCALYEEIYGELSDELGIPYLLYAKSLIALALDENKVIDVPDEEEDDDDEEDVDESNVEIAAEKKNGTAAAGTLETIKDNEEGESSEANEKKVEQTKEADSTDGNKPKENTADSTVNESEENEDKHKKTVDELVVTSTEDVTHNRMVTEVTTSDSEIPSTSNGIVDTEEEEDNEAASSLQLAWEILELAAKIFTRQGFSGLSNLAEVQTELANIEFENNILDSAREDYGKAIKIYKELPEKYRRAMAEIHYKVGLTYLMQQMNKEGAESLKEACSLIEGEITEIKAKENLTDKDKENIKDLEETNQEIEAKIAEIEETRQQNIAEVRAALDNFISPANGKTDDGAGTSSSAASSSAITSSSKPTDISHLIKRKKPDTDPSSEAEAAESPAKRPAV